jgi:hypothetical protein
VHLIGESIVPTSIIKRSEKIAVKKSKKNSVPGIILGLIDL